MTAVVLVGLMGAGKTTVGRAVAARTGWTLVDVDVAIQDRTGRTVRELWEEGGEAAYRALESEIVLDALADEEVVIAAPGGVVLDPAVRDALAEPFVVWLRASPTTLGGRVRRDDHRPLLGDDPETVLATMTAERADLYASVADLVVDADATPPDELAGTIVAELSARSAEASSLHRRRERPDAAT